MTTLEEEEVSTIWKVVMPMRCLLEVMTRIHPPAVVCRDRSPQSSMGTSALGPARPCPVYRKYDDIKGKRITYEICVCRRPCRFTGRVVGVVLFVAADNDIDVRLAYFCELPGLSSEV